MQGIDYKNQSIAFFIRKYMERDEEIARHSALQLKEYEYNYKSNHMLPTGEYLPSNATSSSSIPSLQ